MKPYSKISVLMRLQMADVSRGCSIWRLLSACKASCSVPLFPFTDKFCVSFVSFLYLRLEKVEVLEVGIHLPLRLRELRFDVLIDYAGVGSKVGKYEMCMSEEEKVGLLVVTFVFVDLCLAFVLHYI